MNTWQPTGSGRIRVYAFGKRIVVPYEATDTEATIRMNVEAALRANGIGCGLFAFPEGMEKETQ